ncbi:hypothetical protein LCGC14_0810310 [marine sediment metagenome]|uniref:Uncharacterized protein n=1 Tax=marine sediment metagenome TaxID=412755 RepID=A0A0F9S716_9ZZZZ
MKIGEAREIALERCCCDMEIARAEVIVLSKKRNKLVVEATDKYAIKFVLKQLEAANKDLKVLSVKQKGLRRKRRDDGREIRSAFVQHGPIAMSRRGRFQFNVEYKDETHGFMCSYNQLFKDDRLVWAKKSFPGIRKTARKSIPSYLVPHVWREVADPWTALSKSSPWAVYLLLENMALDHVWISSASHGVYGSRWIYGAGYDRGTFRVVTGNAGRSNVVCTELDDTMDIAILKKSSGSKIFVGAASGKVLQIPLYGWGGSTKVYSRKARRSVDRDYSTYERLAWHYLRNYANNTVKEKNRIPADKLRVKKKGHLWRPE